MQSTIWPSGLLLLTLGAMAVLGSTLGATPVATYRTARLQRSGDPSAPLLSVEWANTNWTADTLAIVSLNATTNVTGSDVITVTANPTVLAENATQAYYGVGFLEGFVTAESIYIMYSNLQLAEFEVAPTNAPAMGWVSDQAAFMRTASRSTATGQTVAPEYGAQLAKILAQVDGLAAGYAAFVAQGGTFAQPLDWESIYLLSLQSELWDAQVFAAAATPSPPVHAEGKLSAGKTSLLPARPQSHCSVLIKPLLDDVFVGHTTWGGYNTMLRQYKTYNFEVTVSFSSYPGFLVSSDDWYITSNGLAIVETTLDIYSTVTYQNQPNSSSTIAAWMRAMIATYLAKSAQEWQRIYCYLNSGTYNNQWMAVDMKLFYPQTALADIPDDFLWISETLPGHCVAADLTSVFRTQGYWASYNVAYFPSIYELSGYNEMKAQYGSFFSYHHYARAEIFARNQSMVTDLESMKALMRYNNFEHDPLSDIPNCTGTIYNNTCQPKRSAMLSISSRGDLDPVANPATMGPLASAGAYDKIGMKNEGGIDSKIASWLAMENGNFAGYFVSGPTWAEVPAFVWSTAPAPIQAVPHWGQPDNMSFTWQTLQPSPVLHTVPSSLSIPPARVTAPAITLVVLAVLAISTAFGVTCCNKFRPERSVDPEGRPLVSAFA